jgi:hypothetical protein
VAAGGVFRPRGPDENNDMVLPFDQYGKSEANGQGDFPDTRGVGRRDLFEA